MSRAKLWGRRSRSRSTWRASRRVRRYSFAEKQGIPVSKLVVVNTPKGEYVAVKQVILGKPAAEILAGVLPEVIREISWPRSMIWAGAQSPRFIRPIRWIVAILDGKMIPFSFADVESGNRHEGHRFLGKKEYRSKRTARTTSHGCKKNFVLCRPEARRKKIEAELQVADQPQRRPRA